MRAPCVSAHACAQVDTAARPCSCTATARRLDPFCPMLTRRIVSCTGSHDTDTQQCQARQIYSDVMARRCKPGYLWRVLPSHTQGRWESTVAVGPHVCVRGHQQRTHDRVFVHTEPRAIHGNAGDASQRRVTFVSNISMLTTFFSFFMGWRRFPIVFHAWKHRKNIDE